jgi:[pyruvate, water dikinase]-phosphate phosphotransferase / [pyruvate, water dikinase] kinase
MPVKTPKKSVAKAKPAPKAKSAANRAPEAEASTARVETESVVAPAGDLPEVERTIFVLSDSTGSTAETVARAAVMQFSDANIRIRRFPNVRTEAALRRILNLAKGENAMVVHTVGLRTLRDLMNYETDRLGLNSLDLLGPLLTRLSTHLGRVPYNLPGLLHQLDDAYFGRVEAVEFTVRHDDGLGMDTLAGADIIIAGVSRTSKTPLSMYLAHLGHRVANVPIVPGIPPPEQLLDAPKEKVFGLIIRPEALIRVREERLRKLGVRKKTSYVDNHAIQEELVQARRLFQSQGWHVIDVSGKAVEEVATELMTHLGMHDA